MLEPIGKAIDIETHSRPKLVPMRLVDGSSDKWIILVDNMSLGFKQETKFSFQMACFIAGCYSSFQQEDEPLKNMIRNWSNLQF